MLACVRIDWGPLYLSLATFLTVTCRVTSDNVKFNPDGNDLDWISYEMDCPDDNSIFIKQPPVPWSVPLRALRTIPDGFALRKSFIPDAGRGIFATVFIKKYTWLANYEGTPLPRCEENDEEANLCEKLETGCEYTFRVHRGGYQRTLIDAGDMRTSNWLRWINCARTEGEQNVAARECHGKIFFQAIRDISPESELLIYYGYEYTTGLGIHATTFEEKFL